ncbi:putative chromatin regulator PHD family [Dioscorea sansibarensis]
MFEQFHRLELYPLHPKMMYGEMQHPCHPEHKLNPENKESPYTCYGCREIGFFTRYTCSEPSCNFYLHKDCVSPPDTTTHHFFPDCNFVFLTSGKPGRYCDACGRDIKGYVYHCFTCGNDLHPCCASLPRFNEDVEITMELKKKVSSKCNFCGKKEVRKGARTWSYVSKCKEYNFHISCVKEMMLENWEKEFLNNSNDREKGLQIERKAPSLQIKLSKNSKDKKGAGGFTKFMKMVKLAIGFIVAAVVGDPTTMFASIITSLITQ